MTKFEKIQKAIQLIKEVKLEIPDDSLVQMFIDEDITRLERLEEWIKN